MPCWRRCPNAHETNTAALASVICAVDIPISSLGSTYIDKLADQTILDLQIGQSIDISGAFGVLLTDPILLYNRMAMFS